MAPLDLTSPWGSWLSYIVPLLIGIGFGGALEASGFGDSRKLAAQFYLKDMTVLKVMFTAIIVAAVLLTAGAAFGLVDMARVWVNPTFLWPGIIGGLIMGVGFIIGGFCPGTSMVAASTLKLDGLVFVIDVALGIFAFGESVTLFEGFSNSTALGRLTLPEFFGVDAGVVVTGVVLMAVAMFLMAELAEAHFGRGVAFRNLRLPRRKTAWAAGGGLVLLALVSAFKGEVNPDERWQQMAAEAGTRLTSRAVYVHPIEVAELAHDTTVYTRILDVRSEAHYNLFHLRKSQLVSLDEIRDPAFVKGLEAGPGNTVFFTVSTDDQRATEAWKLLTAQGVGNLYIIEGGINAWLSIFPPSPCLASPREGAREPEQLAFDFRHAAGDRCYQAFPLLGQQPPEDCYLASTPDSDAHSGAGTHQIREPALAIAFERKVKLEKKAAAKGGCG